MISRTTTIGKQPRLSWDEYNFGPLISSTCLGPPCHDILPLHYEWSGVPTYHQSICLGASTTIPSLYRYAWKSFPECFGGVDSIGHNTPGPYSKSPGRDTFDCETMFMYHSIRRMTTCRSSTLISGSPPLDLMYYLQILEIKLRSPDGEEYICSLMNASSRALLLAEPSGRTGLVGRNASCPLRSPYEED